MLTYTALLVFYGIGAILAVLWAGVLLKNMEKVPAGIVAFLGLFFIITFVLIFSEALTLYQQGGIMNLE